MKRVALWLLAMPLAAGVYLRDTGAPVAVTGATNTTPVVITAPGHGFENGDTVFIQFVLGNTAANGVRRVKNRTQDTFEITDLAGQDIAGNGTFSAAANPIVGKVTVFELGTHPRLIFSGSSGRARVTDPDGSGPQVAPCVAYGSPCHSGDRSGCTTWDALVARLSGVTTPGCDGRTPGLCPNEDANFSVYKAQLAALGWYADRSKSEWLNAAKYWINNLERSYARKFTACDVSAYHCGRGEENDAMSAVIASYALVYTLIRDQLTEAERQAFARKILNDEPSCTNQLQKQPGTANLTSGSATVTGSGFSGYAAGDRIYFKTTKSVGSTGAWYTVQSVVSDTELLLTSASGVTASGADHYRVMPWTESTCGINWFVSHHGYTPGALNKRGGHPISAAMDASQTTFTVSSISNWLDPPPFYVKIDSEWMRVTGIEGSGPYTVTVERGALYSTPAAHSAGKTAMWTRYVLANYGNSGSYFYQGDWRHNLTFQKLYGYILPAAALAGDDARADPVLEAAWNYWYDYTYQLNKRQWTGFSGGASNIGYGLGRWAGFTYSLVFWAKHGLSPALDLSGGQWLKNIAYHLPYLQLPYQPGYTIRFQDPVSSGDQEIENDDMQFLAIIQDLYPGSPEAAYINFWVRNLSSSPTNGSYPFRHYYSQATSWGEEMIPYYLLFTDDSQPSSDYRAALAPWRFFTSVDGTPPTPFGLAVSRTGWTNTDDTQVFVLGLTARNDHWPTYPGPGNYKIAKKTRLLDDNAGGGSGYGAQTNYVEVGGATNIQSGTVFDRQRGATDFVYTRANTTGAYTSTAKVTAAYRHLFHLKGVQDYVVVYDAVKTSTTNQKRLRLHYFVEGMAASSTLQLDGTAVTFTKGTVARLSSRILLPAGASISYSGPSSYAYTVMVDAGQTSESDFLVVHRPSANPNDMMPAVRLISEISNNFRGVEIEDASRRWIVLVARESSADAVSFTPQAYAGTAEILIAGLDAGLYTVWRNGQELVRDQAVGTEGILRLTAAAGSFAISKSGVLPLEILTTSLPGGTVGASYSATLEASGGTPPYNWSVIAGSLPAGLSLNGSTGEITGTPSTAGTAGFTVQVTDAAQRSATRALTLTVEAASEELSILTSQLPDAVVGQPYSQWLAAGGGTPPYRWSVVSGALPAGLTLSAEGLISGTPSSEGTSSFVVEVRDSASPAATATRTLELSVNGVLTITTNALPDAVVGQPYSFSLQASGGRTPYSWSVAGGALPPGLSLDPDSGLVSGIPSMSGLATILLRVTDSASPPSSATKEFSLRVEPAAGSLALQPALLAGRQMLVRYGKQGLDANQICTLAASTDPSFSHVVETGLDGGGAAVREYIFGLSAGLEPQTVYYLRATCGSERAQATASTPPAPPLLMRHFQVSFQAPPIPGVDHVLVEYGSGLELDQSLILPCVAGACQGEWLLPLGQLIRLRRSYRDSAGRVLASGAPVAALIQ